VDAGSPMLLVRPSKTKLHFLRYLQQYGRVLDVRIVGVWHGRSSDKRRPPTRHLRRYFHESAQRRGRNWRITPSLARSRSWLLNTSVVEREPAIRAACS